MLQQPGFLHVYAEKEHESLVHYQLWCSVSFILFLLVITASVIALGVNMYQIIRYALPMERNEF